MLHDEIVNFEVAKLAKEKGFNAKCKWLYSKDKSELSTHCTGEDFWNKYDLVIAAPTQSLLQRWLREEKGIHIEIVATACGYFWIADKTNGTAITDSDILDRGTNEGGCFDTYEHALEDALKHALENLI